MLSSVESPRCEAFAASALVRPVVFVCGAVLLPVTCNCVAGALK